LRADTITDTTTPRITAARSTHYGMHDPINKSLFRKIIKYDIKSYSHEIGKFTLKSKALAGLGVVHNRLVQFAEQGKVHTLIG